MRPIRTVPAMTVLLLAAALAGCGGGTGGGGPGLIGSLQAAVAPPPGAMSNGLVGSEVGIGLADADRNRALRAEYDALEAAITGAPVVWQSPSGAAYGEVVAGPLQNIGQYECRYYTHTMYIGGVREAAAGTSCRIPGGAWALAL
jgi:surface antigen